MNNNTAVMQNLQKILASGSVPDPAGTDENGQPYWIIEGETVGWAQMQQQLWQLTRQQQGSSGGSGGGFEQMPQMPSMGTIEQVTDLDTKNWEQPASPEQQLEQSEQRAEQAGEQQTRIAQQKASKAPQQQTEDDDTAGPALMGDSVKLQSVSIRNPKQMLEYYKKVSSHDPNKSSSYLASVFGKILRMLSVK